MAGEARQDVTKLRLLMIGVDGPTTQSGLLCSQAYTTVYNTKSENTPISGSIRITGQDTFNCTGFILYS